MTLTEAQRMEMWSVPISKSLDGSGVVHLRMRRGSLIALKLDQFPTPKDYGRIDPVSGKRRITPRTVTRGANQGYFRVAYAWNPEGTRPHTASFALSSSYNMETLQVITDHLNKMQVDWLYLTNRNGNLISKSCFRSTVSA